MDRPLPHLPQPRAPFDPADFLSREYVSRLGRLSAAVLVAGVLLDDEALAGFGVCE